MSKDYLHSGRVLIAQTQCYLNAKRRKRLAQKFVEGGAANMLRNLKYYNARDKELSHQISKIEQFITQIPLTTAIDELMGLEGNIRQNYYEAFDVILTHFEMGNREKQPPSNEVNALISFGNMVCYTLCLDQIYHTQLSPLISYLHVPGERRYSLALDLAEVFKPILVDRLIFSLLNKKQIQAKDFDAQVGKCWMKESGKKTFMRAWDEKLSETIKHRALGKHVSYKTLVRLECYKLIKDIIEMEEYEPFKIWW
jgi:CRISPR-associated protein Cas1